MMQTFFPRLRAPVPEFALRLMMRIYNELNESLLNFGRLVLGYTNAAFCKCFDSLVGKLLTRSTGFACFWQFAPLRPQHFSNICPNIIASLYDFSTQKRTTIKYAPMRSCSSCIGDVPMHSCLCIRMVQFSRAHYFLLFAQNK